MRAADHVLALVALLLGLAGAICAVLYAGLAESGDAPPVLVVGAAAGELGAVAAGVLYVRLGLARQVGGASLAALAVAIARTRNTSLAGAMTSATLAIGFAMVAAIAPLGFVTALCGALAAVAAGGARWFAVRAAQLWEPRASWLFRLVAERPSELASFAIVPDGGRADSELLVVTLAAIDGRVAKLRVTAHDVGAVGAELARAAPHAGWVPPPVARARAT